MPAFQAPLMASRMYWVISGRGGRTPSIPAIREAIAQIDPDVATSSARTLEVLWSTSLGSDAPTCASSRRSAT
jgi:hypothetical protein